MAQEEARPDKAEEFVVQPAREREHLCAHCGAPLRSAREQSARLCDWCEEGRNKPS